MFFFQGVGRERRDWTGEEHLARTMGRQAPFALIGLGVLLRLGFFLAKPPLWGDEAMIALSFHESPLSWFSGLRFYQTAPFGYLLLSSGAVHLFGDGVLALRLVPFLVGLVTLPVFWKFAEALLPRPWALFALAILALSSPSIYYSGETKQYALDALVAVLLLRVALPGQFTNSDRRKAAVLGVICVLFSQAAVFILTGAAIWLWTGKREGSRKLGVIWALTAVLGVLLYSQAMPPGTRAVMDDFWANAFLPFPPTFDAYWRAFTGLFDKVVGGPLPWSLGLVSLWGVIRSRDRRIWLQLLPLLLAAAASLFHAYPFSPLRDGAKMGRLFLFALPSLIILVSAGLRHSGRVGPALAIVVISLVGFRGIRTVLDPPSVFYRPDITEAINLIRAQQDTVVVPPHILPLFLYYSAREGLEVAVRTSEGVTGDTFEKAWIYTDWVPAAGEESFLSRFCRGTCQVRRLGQQYLLRVEDPPR